MSDRARQSSNDSDIATIQLGIDIIGYPRAASAQYPTEMINRRNIVRRLHCKIYIYIMKDDCTLVLACLHVIDYFTIYIYIYIYIYNIILCMHDLHVRQYVSPQSVLTTGNKVIF